MNRQRGLQFVSLCAVLSVWHLATAITGIVPETVLPTPTGVLAALGQLLVDKQFLSHIGWTVRRTLLASVMAVPIGVAVGFAMGTNETVRSALAPFLYGLYPMPVVALLPLVILTLGSDEQAIVVLGALGGFFVLVWNAMDGARAIDPVYLAVARNYGVNSRVTLVREVLLPGALPSLFTGFRLCLSTSLLIIISIEFITANSGLGFAVWRSWQLLDLQRMYAAIAVIGFLGIGVTYGLARLQALLVPWTTRTEDGLPARRDG